ncbi:MAG: HK97 gp10 family phage protein [Rhizobiales bacterium]|nr:HK97 gp10 family phage protein [Hyphomicrobiales bacterium]
MANDGGIARLERRLAAIPADVKAAALPAVKRQAEAMADTMRGLVPVDRGDLRDSITVTPAGQQTPAYSQPGGSMVVPENATAVTVGNADVRYGHLVEYGHGASGFSSAAAPAKPFFWPSVRLHQAKAKRAIKSAIGKAVKKNWGKA